MPVETALPANGDRLLEDEDFEEADSGVGKEEEKVNQEKKEQ